MDNKTTKLQMISYFADFHGEKITERKLFLLIMQTTQL
jgi:hypothetical protein